MDTIKEKNIKAFKNLCFDCLYYGYGWIFIKNNYLKNWDFTEDEAKKLYNEVLKNMEEM